MKPPAGIWRLLSFMNMKLRSHASMTWRPRVSTVQHADQMNAKMKMGSICVATRSTSSAVFGSTPSLGWKGSKAQSIRFSSASRSAPSTVGNGSFRFRRISAAAGPK